MSNFVFSSRSNATLHGSIKSCKSFVGKTDKKDYTAVAVEVTVGFGEKARKCTITAYALGKVNFAAGTNVLVLGEIGTGVAFKKSDTNKYAVMQPVVRNAIIAECDDFGSYATGIVCGKVFNAPRKLTSKSGKPGCAFDIAVTKQIAEGNTKESRETAYIPVTCWDGEKRATATQILEHVKAGTLVSLAVSLSTYERTVDGTTKDLLGLTVDGFAVSAEQPPVEPTEEKTQAAKTVDDDDEIPF